MVLQLLRTYHPKGTNGELFYEGKKICNTIELPMKNNRPQVSCIPEGTYTLAKRYSLANGWHIHVTDVPGRFWILIHRFNDALKESQGCIAPVEKIEAPGRGGPSKPAFERLMKLLKPAFVKKETILLIIKEKEDAKPNCTARAA